MYMVPPKLGRSMEIDDILQHVAPDGHQWSPTQKLLTDINGLGAAHMIRTGHDWSEISNKYNSELLLDYLLQMPVNYAGRNAAEAVPDISKVQKFEERQSLYIGYLKWCAANYPGEIKRTENKYLISCRQATNVNRQLLYFATLGYSGRELEIEPFRHPKPILPEDVGVLKSASPDGRRCSVRSRIPQVRFYAFPRGGRWDDVFDQPNSEQDEPDEPDESEESEEETEEVEEPQEQDDSDDEPLLRKRARLLGQAAAVDPETIEMMLTDEPIKTRVWFVDASEITKHTIAKHATAGHYLVSLETGSPHYIYFQLASASNTVVVTPETFLKDVNRPTSGTGRAMSLQRYASTFEAYRFGLQSKVEELPIKTSLEEWWADDFMTTVITPDLERYFEARVKVSSSVDKKSFFATISLIAKDGATKEDLRPRT
jgi:hypothetical protein